MRLGIFGGTFNPVHIGHLRAAEEVRHVCGLDRIIFIPSGSPPLKTSDIAEPLHREAMTRLATGSNNYFEVSDIEMRDGDKSYTVKTVEKVREIYPNDDLFFIMGMDAFLDLPKWREPERIISSIDFIIMTRPGHDNRAVVMSPFVESVEEEGESLYCRLKGGRQAVIAVVSALDISSSAIRQLIRSGGSIRYLVPEAVEQYIAEHRLYRVI